MTEKTKKELIEYIKLKDKLEYLNKNLTLEKNIKNPFETLIFNKAETKIKRKGISYKFWFLVLVVLFLTTSILFNKTISLKIDPVLYKFINHLSTQLNKPYVVTIGNFESFDLAKSRAVEFLPKLRQINIKQLPTGNYTFEIEKCGSKEKAYSISKEFIQNGFEPVNVRYLPGQ
ncbi:MAG: hypothetical protein A3I68_05200 [Candidatus Melainabacteria bacterium RIFCSPLOWO2_02_FULL_35_15]|nr:MAG: hypothetical protein A3F80_07510 [Candidatus Melainabacteria bacterium RIFCSPLOWO2_12_FULL_35_11]OGI12847.1 MAG: hypothetical protein A3I68_05200 [Candidatus Melainabacteria bacterium RIFCSPLOWO2_02_FULL_35_15]